MGPAVGWLAHHLAIFPNAGRRSHQIKHNFRRHPYSTLGEWYRGQSGFTGLLTIKLTLTTC